MEKQYCKVGAITPITGESYGVSVLEYQYRNFMDKASSTKSVDRKLADFFESKAIKVKKMLENLM